MRAIGQFHGLVQGLLIKALGPRAEVDDLVGDIFVRVFENAGRVRSAEAFRSYVVSITMNTIRRELRNRRRDARLFDWSGGDQLVEQQAGVDDPEAKAALLQLARILNELSATDRRVFVLHTLDGMALHKVAKVMQISHSTAKRRSRRAATHLRKRVSRNALLADYVARDSG
ncbi:MAG TPA: sigma-70 family RNA polymerase sigma factor [Polyangiaceae bacterium]|nr:sigma-70 family RNA polymerase sigma factor [Polyangiaceae bacterium]